MPFGQRMRRRAGTHTRWPKRLLGRQTDGVPWNPSRWSSSLLWHWFHGGVPSAGLASTIQGGVGNTTTGWNDASGNARHVNTTIGGTPDVVLSGQSEGVNFAIADSEYIQGNINAPSDQSGTYFMRFRLASGDNENTSRTIVNWGASSSGSRNLAFRLFTSGGETSPDCFAQNSTNTAFIRINVGANIIVPDTVYTLAVEADGTGNAYRIWLNETEVTGGSVTVTTAGSGVAGYWLADINAGAQLNRFSISGFMNGHIYEVGYYQALLGSDESNLMGHLARQRAIT